MNLSGRMDTMITPSTSPLGLSPNALFSSNLPSQPNCHLQQLPSMHLLHRRCNDRQQPLSASIPLPKSHVHRTRSELQLADDVRRAEYEDVRMCVRLVVGMQSQCIKSGYVHPLTEQSLREILRTKAADERGLERKLREHHRAATAAEPTDDDDDWEVSYLGAATSENSSINTPPGRPWHTVGTSSGAPALVKYPSDGSMVSNFSSEEYPEDDDCVFSLEL